MPGQVPLLAFYNVFQEKLQDPGRCADAFLDKWAEFTEGIVLRGDVRVVCVGVWVCGCVGV